MELTVSQKKTKPIRQTTQATAVTQMMLTPKTSKNIDQPRSMMILELSSRIVISILMLVALNIRHSNGIFPLYLFIITISAYLCFLWRFKVWYWIIIFMLVFIMAHLTYISLSDSLSSYYKIAFQRYFEPTQSIMFSKFFIYIYVSAVGTFIIILAHHISRLLTALIRKKASH